MALSADEFERKLGAHMMAHGILAEHLRFPRPVHSVAEAAQAAGAQVEDLVKSVVCLQESGALTVAIVKGEDRVSLARVRGVVGGGEVRTASAEEVLRRTGYPAGGVPPFGFPATFLVDPRVLLREWVLAGGGSDRALLRIGTEELLRACGGRLEEVRRGGDAETRR